MDLVVTYDVNTETQAGRRRLRKVAQICQNYGQRVQLSVFECRVGPLEMERLRNELEETIDDSSDSLRIYKLSGGRDRVVVTMGRDTYVNYDDPLIG
jgi:CRISPR-associated protein Cas2